MSEGKTTAIRRRSSKDQGIVDLPHRGIYGFALSVIRPYITKRYNVRIVKAGVENVRPPYVVLANHLSKLDWMFVGISFWPDVLNVVITRYFYSNPALRTLLKAAGAIPKDQFSPDLNAVRNIMSVIKRGGNVMLFPEGRTTPHGLNETFERSTIKLLKHLGVPVLYMHHDGSYLSNPKWTSDYRCGRIDVTVGQLFSAEDLKAMDDDALFARMCTALRTDEYAWQAENRVPFKTKHIAGGLENLLYKCPRCGADMTTVTDDTAIRCTACGNGAALNEYYDLIPFDGECVIPENIGRWFVWQVKKDRELIDADPDFSITDHAVLRELTGKKKWLEPVGDGTLVLNREGLRYTGTRQGEDVELFFPIASLPAVAFTSGGGFELYYNKEAFSFLPDDLQSSQRWSVLAEQLHDAVCGNGKNQPVFLDD